MIKHMNIEYTVNNDLCTGCGICINACPKNCIKTVIDHDEFRPSIDSAKCVSCGKCLKSCPGIGINLKKFSKDLFPDGKNRDDYIGTYDACYTGYSNSYDIRFHSASGGVTTQFLIWLLDNKKIDGAIVTKFDKSHPLKVNTFIARTSCDILSAKSSKYGPVSLDSAIQQIKSMEGEKFVVVGLPCHIQGIRKLCTFDKELNNKIYGLFSLYCSGTRTFGFTRYLLKERRINIDDIDFLAYRDNGCLGGLVIKGEGIDYYQDYQKYSHPLRTIFYPQRCFLCIDHFGELSDISFGDIHVKPYSDDKVGINSLIVRNHKWLTLIKQAAADGVITLNELNPDLLLKSQPIARLKKTRNLGFCFLRKRIGKKSPDYNNKESYIINCSLLVKYCFYSSLMYIGRHQSLWWTIQFIKSKKH